MILSPLAQAWAKLERRIQSNWYSLRNGEIFTLIPMSPPTTFFAQAWILFCYSKVGMGCKAFA